MNFAHAQTDITKVFFKDGKFDENGNKTFIIDYVVSQYDSTSPQFRLEPINGANAVVTDTQIQLAGTLKVPVPDNPNAFDIIPMDSVLDIKRVEAINGGQLNNYTLNSGSEFAYASFTETSPTNATMTTMFDMDKFNDWYFSGLE